jgi:hypothetical protein
MAIASFHLVRHRRRRVPALLARFVTDRRHLRAAPGLRFWRLLGTGRGRTMSASADLTRWALFAVWEDEAALEAFLDTSPVACRWAGAVEAWHVRLADAQGHGRWTGADVVELASGGEHPEHPGTAGEGAGPVAILTRATVRARRLRQFLRAGRPVDAVLGAAPGLLATVGIGEAPVGRQATFSLWRSVADARRFAYDDPVHAEVVRRTREEGWYAEELFVRFRPYHSAGTWDGVDPLAPAGDAGGASGSDVERARTDRGTTGTSIP